jgi:NADPH-dependent 2,4-dienoyl-CoA reductase/sulfur reductase-like enzyme
MRRRRRARSYERIVIVGGGRAGVAAAEELRQLGYEGDLIVLCDEPQAPYDRPSCSKGLLTGKLRPKDMWLPIKAGTDIQWRLNTRVVGLDQVAQRVFTAAGEGIPYDGLVIASGTRAVRPEKWPFGKPGLHALHALEDAWALRHALRDARRVAIVGAGLTGCEAACAMRSMARDCVLIDPNAQVMTRALGDTVGTLVTDQLDIEGIKLELNQRVQHIERHRRGWVLQLNRGEVEADVVIATLGERPDTEWLKGTGIDISDGVLCDERLRVVGTDQIVAAGSVARWPNLRTGKKPARVGQWIAALEMGQAAARTLMAHDNWPPIATVTPRFWSEQAGLRIQVCGDTPAGAEVSITEMRPSRGKRAMPDARAGVLVTYNVDHQLVGVVGVNAAHAFTSISRAMLANDAKPYEVPVATPAPLSAPMAPPVAVAQAAAGMQAATAMPTGRPMPPRQAMPHGPAMPHAPAVPQGPAMPQRPPMQPAAGMPQRPPMQPAAGMPQRPPMQPAAGIQQRPPMQPAAGIQQRPPMQPAAGMPVAPGAPFGRPMAVGPPSAAPGSPVTAEIPLPMDWPMIGEMPDDQTPVGSDLPFAAEMPLAAADAPHTAQALAAQALAEDVPVDASADQGPQYRTRRRHLRSVA